jgi:putative transposase
MKGKRYSVEKIIRILQEYESGIKTKDLCRKYGMSSNTFYNWKAKYGGMTVSEAHRLKELEEENRQLKHIVAEQALDIKVLKAVNSKNF